VWVDNSSDEVGFKIHRKTGSLGSYGEIASVGAGITSYTDTPLASGTTYFYKVLAYNTGGDSAFSNEAGATTLADTVDPLGFPLTKNISRRVPISAGA